MQVEERPKKGRPPGKPMRRVCVSIPEEQYAVLTQAADAADVSFSKLVRAAIKEWVDGE